MYLKSFSVVDPWQVWQDIQRITNNKTNDPTTANSDASVAWELNCSFACVEMKTPRQADTTPLPASNSYTRSVEERDVRLVLKMGKTREAASPDGSTGRVMKGDDVQTISLRSSQRFSNCPV